MGESWVQLLSVDNDTSVCLWHLFSCIFELWLFSNSWRYACIFIHVSCILVQGQVSTLRPLFNKASTLSSRPTNRPFLTLRDNSLIQTKKKSVDSTTVRISLIEQTESWHDRTLFETSHNCCHHERFQRFITTPIGATWHWRFLLWKQTYEFLLNLRILADNLFKTWKIPNPTLKGSVPMKSMPWHMFGIKTTQDRKFELWVCGLTREKFTLSLSGSSNLWVSFQTFLKQNQLMDGRCSKDNTRYTIRSAPAQYVDTLCPRVLGIACWAY